MTVHVFRKTIVSIILASFIFVSSSVSATPVREFIMSCTYGVLAGTLVGSATLAFTSQPGENLNLVAKGASLGLYAGIALGLYVVYGVPADNVERDIYGDIQFGEGVIGNDKRLLPPETSYHFKVYPLVSERGLEGAGAGLSILGW